MQSSLHLFLSWIGAMVTLGTFVMSIILLSFGLSERCDQPNCLNKAFTTNTFYSTRTPDFSSGWPVATDRYLSSELVTMPSKNNNWPWVHYYECMSTAKLAAPTCGTFSSISDYSNCLQTNNMTKLVLAQCNAYSASYFYNFPTMDQYIRCISSYPVMQANRNNQQIFKTCLHSTLWPFYEVPQGIDSGIIMSSYNWVVFMCVGLWAMTSFAVYTVSPFDYTEIVYGQPTSWKRLGSLWIFASFIWNLVLFIIMLVLVVRNNTTWDDPVNPYPITISTSIIVLTGILVCLVYFAAELTETEIGHYLGISGKTAMHHIVHHAKKGYHAFTAKSNVNSLSAPFPEKGGAYTNLSPFYYTAPLVTAWADGYLLDAFIVAGLAGATGQLTTDQSWNLFTMTLIYRVINMALARFMVECFSNNIRETDAVNNAKHSKIEMTILPPYDDPANDIKVMALGTQIAAWYIFIGLCIMVFDSNTLLSEFDLFKTFFILGFIVPEIIRSIVHLLCQFFYTTSFKGTILISHEVVWIWDLIIRLVFCSIVYFQTDVSVMGTRTFLQSMSNNLMNVYPSLLFY